MRKLAISMLIATTLGYGPAMAASCGGCGLNKGAAGASAVEVDDLLRRIERDLDRLTRGLDRDVAHIEKKRQPAATTPTGSPQPRR